MSPMIIFNIAWQLDAAAVCVAVSGLLWQFHIMQPVAHIAQVCSGCRRVSRVDDEEHGRVTQEIVIVGGRR